MKQISLLVFSLVVFSQAVVAQEIIPFPDLSDSHLASSGHTDMIDDHNYSLFTEDYQEALVRIDQDIEILNSQINSTSDKTEIDELTADKSALDKKRMQLLEEAELLEDLNKFY